MRPVAAKEVWAVPLFGTGTYGYPADMPIQPDWSRILDPWAGGPGEPPGFRETVERIRERGPKQKPARKSKTKKKR